MCIPDFDGTVSTAGDHLGRIKLKTIDTVGMAQDGLHLGIDISAVPTFSQLGLLLIEVSIVYTLDRIDRFAIMI